MLLVTNEVGMGIVPADRVTRTYRDWLGRLNQRVASVSDRVTLLVSGIPLAVKGPSNP
jgi:adenosylcobinamide kinase/adenosylcobinamide-phosphate guanylyltransferase